MRRWFSLIMVIIGYFAVISQFKLMIDTSEVSPTETLIRFFSFFTILTNSMVAIYHSFELAGSKRLRKPALLTALTVYIFIVGLIYQIALRSIWEPQGLAMVVDELLHSLIPFLSLIYWWLYEDAKLLKWEQIPWFLIYPLIYLIYILIRGAYSGFYPYPFLQVDEIGWTQSLQNIGLLFFTFLAFGSLFLGLVKRKQRS
ncbi:Pr6Pr family membrane protein [Croceimicrobium sp.]|uniref:Pr6Pr family membrane protein n=1 Tax=Croceimicrobium sp. TaxID=2828340 RepID=UPI003BAC1FD5